MDIHNYGFGTDFADAYTVSWNENRTAAVIGVNRMPLSGSGNTLIIVRMMKEDRTINTEPYVFHIG
jgi:hypothetical protein